MTQQQIQELRDNLANAVFSCVALFRSDFEHIVDAPKGVGKDDILYVSDRGDIGYRVSYNHEREMVSLRGNLEYEDGHTKEIMSFDPNHFTLMQIVDKFVEFILK